MMRTRTVCPLVERKSKTHLPPVSACIRDGGATSAPSWRRPTVTKPPVATVTTVQQTKRVDHGTARSGQKCQPPVWKTATGKNAPQPPEIVYHFCFCLRFCSEEFEELKLPLITIERPSTCVCFLSVVLSFGFTYILFTVIFPFVVPQVRRCYGLSRGFVYKNGGSQLFVYFSATRQLTNWRCTGCMVRLWVRSTPWAAWHPWSAAWLAIQLT